MMDKSFLAEASLCLHRVIIPFIYIEVILVTHCTISKGLLTGARLSFSNLGSHFIFVKIFQLDFSTFPSFHLHPNISDIFVGDKINISQFHFFICSNSGRKKRQDELNEIWIIVEHFENVVEHLENVDYFEIF